MLRRLRRERGIIKRVKAGDCPTLSLDLADNEAIVSVRFSELFDGARSERTTTDYVYEVYIEARAE